MIATTDEGTRAALSEARHIARRLRVSRPVLIVPRVGSPTPSLDARAVEQTMVEDGEALRWMLPRPSVVVIGGRSRWWWPTREQRIADRLKSAGHETVFADASRPRHAGE